MTHTATHDRTAQARRRAVLRRLLADRHRRIGRLRGVFRRIAASLLRRPSAARLLRALRLDPVLSDLPHRPNLSSLGLGLAGGGGGGPGDPSPSGRS